MFIQKLNDENEKLKVKIMLMKSQAEYLKELRKEVTKKKWVETMLHYKQQQEALSSQVETLRIRKKRRMY